MFFCLTYKIGFPLDGEAFVLKMRARCVEKKIFASVSFIMKFFDIITAAALVRFTRKNSLITFLYAYPFYMLATCSNGLMLMFAEQRVADGFILPALMGVNLATLLAHHGVYLRFEIKEDIFFIFRIQLSFKFPAIFSNTVFAKSAGNLRYFAKI